MAKADYPSTTPLAQEIRDLLPKLQRAILAKTDADEECMKMGVVPEADAGYRKAAAHADELEETFAALCREAWAAPVRSFEDVVLLAEIVQHIAGDWPVYPTESEPLLDPPSHWPVVAVGSL